MWVLFSLGNSSDAFLVLRARDLGLGVVVVVLAYAVYNVIYCSLSWPFGALSDRVPRSRAARRRARGVRARLLRVRDHVARLDRLAAVCGLRRVHRRDRGRRACVDRGHAAGSCSGRHRVRHLLPHDGRRVARGERRRRHALDVREPARAVRRRRGRGRRWRSWSSSGSSSAGRRRRARSSSRCSEAAWSSSSRPRSRSRSSTTGSPRRSARASRRRCRRRSSVRAAPAPTERVQRVVPGRRLDVHAAHARRPDDGRERFPRRCDQGRERGVPVGARGGGLHDPALGDRSRPTRRSSSATRRRRVRSSMTQECKSRVRLRITIRPA